MVQTYHRLLQCLCRAIGWAQARRLGMLDKQVKRDKADAAAGSVGEKGRERMEK